MLTAQLGLEPGPLGHAYLVPYKKECTFILGYKGMIELARRSDRLGSIRAATVYEGDEFDYYETQSGPKLRHVECPPDERGPIVCDYAIASVRSGRAFLPHVKRLWPVEIEAARKRSQLGRLGKGPWQTDETAMRHKTCIRRLAPVLPMTPMFGVALDSDDRSVAGFSDGEVVIEGEATEVGDD
jgi:recombination protein RecT